MKLSNIEATCSTVQAKKYLLYYGNSLTADVISNALEKYCKNTSDSDLVHLQIFLFISDPSVKDLLEKFNDELLPFNHKKENGITIDFYLDLLFRLNLHDEFLQLAFASHKNQLSTTLMLSAVSMVKEDCRADKIDQDIVTDYLVTLTELAVMEEGTFYTDLLRRLLTTYVENGLVANESKVLSLLKIMDVALMKTLSPGGSNHIFEFIKEVKCDPTSKFKTGKTFGLFHELYKGQTNEVRSDHSYDIRNILTLLIPICAEPKLLHRTDGIMSRNEIIDYIGNYAYIAYEILRCQVGVSKELENFSKSWSQFKPKISFTDFNFNSTVSSFDEFCQLLAKHWRHPTSQKQWFLQFLEYSDCCENLDGLAIIDTIIAPNADVDIAVSVIEKLRATMKLKPEDEDQIKRLISTVADNQLISSEREEFVRTIFKDGIHSDFMCSAFEVELNSLLTKIGALEGNSKEKCISGTEFNAMEKEKIEYQNALLRLCFQNPMDCMVKLVPLALKTQKFKSLQFASVYLSLEVREPIKSRCKFSSSPTLLDYSLFNLLWCAQDKDSAFDTIGKNLPHIVAKKFMSFEKLSQILEYCVSRLICMDYFDKWLRVLRVYTTFFTFVLATESPEEHIKKFVIFIQRLLIGLSLSLRAENHQPIIEGREKCFEVLTLAKQRGLIPQCGIGYTTDDLSGWELLDLGLVYIRNPPGRKSLTEYLEKDKSLFQHVTEIYLKTCLLTWVAGSCRYEWKDMLEFLQDIVMKSGLQTNVDSIVRETILISSKQGRIRVSHYLQFFTSYLHFRQQEQFDTYKEMFEEHRSVVKTFAIIFSRLYDPSQTRRTSRRRTQFPDNAYRSGLVQQSLLSLLDFVEWLILKSTHFEEIQEDCINFTSKLEDCVRLVGFNTSMPILMTIISKVKDGKNDLSTFERSISSIKISSPNESGVQVCLTGNPEKNSEILGKYKMFYQEEIDEPKPQTAVDMMENKDLYPFQQKVTNAAPVLNVQLRYD